MDRCGYPVGVPALCARIFVDIMDASSSALDADDLHCRICASFDAVIEACGRRDDALELLYPLAALADESLVNVPRYRRRWLEDPIQLRYYGAVAAGTEFFTRLESLLSVRGGSAYLLELYFICLAGGFKGMYGALDGRQLNDIAANLGVLLMDAKLSEEMVRVRDAKRGTPISEMGIVRMTARIPKILAYPLAASLAFMLTAAAAFIFASSGLLEFLRRLL